MPPDPKNPIRHFRADWLVEYAERGPKEEELAKAEAWRRMREKAAKLKAQREAA